MEQLSDAWPLILPLVFVIMIPFMVAIGVWDYKREKKKEEANPAYWIVYHWGKDKRVKGKTE